MKLILLISILVTIALVALLLVVLLYRHKKGASGEVLLVGQVGQVNSALNPEGSVIVQGELWPARSVDESHVPVQARVRIVDTQGHLLIVSPCPKS